MVKPRNNNNRRRNNRRPGGNNNGNNFESNGPSIKVRGSSKQIYEKYISLARDAQTSDDNVLLESYYQHAEHYARLLIESGNVKPNIQNTQEKVLDSKEEIKENVIPIPENNDLDVAEGS